jgi:hypothetical protein
MRHVVWLLGGEDVQYSVRLCNISGTKKTVSCISTRYDIDVGQHALDRQYCIYSILQRR